MTTRRCVECGRPQKPVRGAVPYPESGLDNVQLMNVPIWRCENGHEEVEIPDVEQLHDLLAHQIVRQPTPLSSRDIRFLRKRLGLSARDFASRMGWTPEWQSQLENAHQAATRTADLLMRLACGVLLAEKTGKSADDLTPLVAELEATMNVAGHRLRHRDQALPNQEWEATA